MTREEAKRIYIEEKAYKRGYEDAKKELDRPHGEWKPDGTCSECVVYSSLNKNTAYFCPNCGALMSANDRQVTGKLNSEIEKSKSEIVPDYRDWWRLREGEQNDS